MVVTGIDAEDGGPGAHGPIANYVTLVSSILNQTANGGDRILVVGANGVYPRAFWNAIASGTGETVVYGNEHTSFAGFQMLAIVGSAPQTFGGLTEGQNNVLVGRQGEFAAFVNGGGGLLGNTQEDFANPYAYLGGVGAFTSANIEYSDIAPTPDGLAVGITDALDVCCWHNVFTQFPSFMNALAYRAGSQEAAALGGARVVLPSQIVLTPGTDTNPVGTTHTVTATLRDGEGRPLPATAVAFTVTGANAGAGGTCNPASCTTNSAGQVTFTYLGTAPGNDTIEACFTMPTGQRSCTTASKTWIAPTLSIDDVTVVEGDAGMTPAVFTVSMSAATSVPVQVRYATANSSAAAGSDYVATSGDLVFAPNQTTRTIAVNVIGDVVDEPNETFHVNLSAPANATVADGRGVGTIIDDDRNGAFSCRASALRLGSTEPAVANPPDEPCADGAATLVTAQVSSPGIVNLRADAKVLDARTDQQPDDLESAAPSSDDSGLATSRVEEVTIVSGGHTIVARSIVSNAEVRCVRSASGALVPTLSSSSTIAHLNVDGVVVNATGSAAISLGALTLRVNERVTTPTSVIQRGIRLTGAGIPPLVISEAIADFRGNPCAQ